MSPHRTIRLFVSSTFRDMHAERDHLNRIVFPELEARCRDYGVRFIGVDLRWGITEDEANSQGVLDACLDKIDECRPYFMCLLGDRFGWVPVPDQIPPETYETAQADVAFPEEARAWYRLDQSIDPPVYRLASREGVSMQDETRQLLIDLWSRYEVPHAGSSITAREVHKAVFENPGGEGQALFYFRNASFSNDDRFPKSFLPLFADADPATRSMLADLKERIGAFPNCKVRQYEVGYRGVRIDPTLIPPDFSKADRLALSDAVIEGDEWDRISPAIGTLAHQYGTIALTGLEEFGNLVLEDIWQVISPELKAGTAGSDDGETRIAQSGPAVDGSQHPSLYKLVEYIDRTDPWEQVVSYLQDADAETPCVVTGRPGVGKTTFMHHVQERLSELFPDRAVVSQFIGATSEPTSAQYVAQAIEKKLVAAHQLDAGAAHGGVSASNAVWLGGLLDRCAEAGDTVILIDAVDQIDVTGAVHALRFLPSRLNRRTKVILSVLTGRMLDRVCEEVSSENVIELREFSARQQKALMNKQLSVRGKSLSDNQYGKLLDKSVRADVALPLYLMVAAEELSLYGDFQTLDRRIDRLPASLHELFDQVLERVELDHGRDLTESVCGLLAVARLGLTESEIQVLLTRMKIAFSEDAWKRLYRSMEAYLRPSGDAQLSFFHNQLKQAAERRYLGKPANADDATLHSQTNPDHARGRFGFYKDKVWSKISGILPDHGLRQSWFSGTATTISRCIVAHFLQSGTEARSIDEISWQMAKYGNARQLYDYISDSRVFLRLQRQGEAELFAYVVLPRLFAADRRVGADAVSHLFGVYVGNGEDMVNACELLRIALPLVEEHFGDKSPEMKSVFRMFAWAREKMDDTLGAQMWQDRVQHGWSVYSQTDKERRLAE